MDRISHNILNYAASATLASCPDIDFTLYAGGIVVVPAASSITQLTFYVAAIEPTTNNTYGNPSDTTKSASYQPITDSNNPLTVAAGNAYAIPANCFGAKAVKIKVTGGSAGNIDVVLKS